MYNVQEDIERSRVRIEALRRYKEQYGKNWKSKLKNHWLIESYNPPNLDSDKPILRQIRNTNMKLINLI